jgi:hypothetical protein
MSPETVAVSFGHGFATPGWGRCTWAERREVYPPCEQAGGVSPARLARRINRCSRSFLRNPGRSSRNLAGRGSPFLNWLSSKQLGLESGYGPQQWLPGGCPRGTEMIFHKRKRKKDLRAHIRFCIFVRFRTICSSSWRRCGSPGAAAASSGRSSRGRCWWTGSASRTS